jgi:cobalamin biosynthesis Co2+ chelatase CbiK
MRTGIIVLGLHSTSPGQASVAERVARFLESNGRRNVRIAYHPGTPSSDEVMEEMNRDGVDTFAILPLVISEGVSSVWHMPSKLGLPDNCGSWRMMNGKDIATRFATALGCNDALAKELVEREGGPQDGTAAILISYGSPNKDCSETASFYSEYLRKAGWRTEVCFCRHGRPVPEAMDSLMAEGYRSIRVIPLFIAFDGPAAAESKKVLESYDAEIEYSEPVSMLDSFLLILDSKVPDGW